MCRTSITQTGKPVLLFCSQTIRERKDSEAILVLLVNCCFGRDESVELKERLTAGLSGWSKLGAPQTGAPGWASLGWDPQQLQVSCAGRHAAPLHWEELQQTPLSVFIFIFCPV